MGDNGTADAMSSVPLLLIMLPLPALTKTLALVGGTIHEHL